MRKEPPHFRINREAYESLLADSDFVNANRNRFGIFHSGRFVDVFNCLDAACFYADSLFPDQDFYIREIDAEPRTLGMRTHLLGIG